MLNHLKENKQKFLGQAVEFLSFWARVTWNLIWLGKKHIHIKVTKAEELIFKLWYIISKSERTFPTTLSMQILVNWYYCIFIFHCELRMPFLKDSKSSKAQFLLVDSVLSNLWLNFLLLKDFKRHPIILIDYIWIDLFW